MLYFELIIAVIYRYNIVVLANVVFNVKYCDASNLLYGSI